MKSAMKFAFRTLHLLLCMLLLYPPQLVLAAGVTASGGTNTTVTTANNGVAVVNIATPNGSGLSHNTYTNYNVDSSGLVLNNGDTSQLARQSQLAGQVAANQNLAAGNQAKVILNEVVANNPSVLAGFTEVLGGKADVIVANPFGITCNGCGFLNTDRASLVTGTPNISGGSLSGFTVTGGEIVITGTGLNASAQQVLDLVARSISVGGQVNAKTLNIVAGRNIWDYGTGAVTSLGSAGGAPAYAIDSSALGGMYAGRISLKATEAGVGVRMLGEAAATSDDFTITSAGAIEVRNKLSAARDMSLSTDATGAGAITLADANLSAGRNLELNAIGGGGTFTGGGIVAGNNLTMNLATLTDAGSATAGITDANKRYAGGALTIANAGLWSLDNTAGALSYGAGGAFSANTGAFALAGTGASLYAGTTLGLNADGSLALTGVGLKSGGDMTLASNLGAISVGSAAGDGVEATAGNITLTSATGLTNAGTVTADAGNLTVRTGGPVSDTGTLNASGTLDIADRAGTGGVAVTLNGGKILGGTTNIKATSLTVTNGGSLESTGDMTLDVSGALAVGTATDSASRIVGASLGATSGTGTASITAGSAFTNYGLVFSGNDLVFSAPAITNTSTGGIAARRDLSLTASTGDLLNQGQLYAGRDLTASTPGTMTNDGTLSAALGNISAERNMSLTAATFVNSGAINGSGDITISAGIFKNEVKGGDTRYWGAAYGYDREYTGGSAYSCGVDRCYDHWFKDTWYQKQEFAGGTPTFSPYIYGGGTLTIKDFSAGYNTFGRISSDTINMVGLTGSTFTNSDLTIQYKTFTQIWEHYYEIWFIGDGPDNWYDKGTTVSTSTYPSTTYRSYIRANTLNASGFSLVNSGSPYTVSPYGRSATGTTFPGLVLTLPTNPNGLYVTSQSSSARYLVETNPLYTDLSNFLGSDYLEKTYGLNTDSILTRLGDAGYETYLVSQQLSTLTGSKLLAGYTTEKAQMQALMDNAGAQAKSLGLTYGTALSASQQANLKEDMVWMVATVVNGQTVLAPVVYLAASTKSLFTTESTGGATIAARNANLNLTSVTNTGGTIAGTQALNITTSGDITNTSGTITGGNVSLTSTGGSVVNQTLAETTGGAGNMATDIGKTGTISSTGNLNVTAAQDIKNLGATISSGGDATLAAGRNVVIDTIEDKSATSNAVSQGWTSTTTTTQVRSNVSSGGNLTVKAANDITVAGSNVSSGGSASLDAGNNVNILARDNSVQTVTETKNEGFGVGGGLWGSEKTNTDHLKTTAVGSTISAGSNINLSAGQTVTLEGANLGSGGDTNISATDVKVMAAKEVDTTTTTKETTTFLSFSSGGDGSGSTSSSSEASKGASSVGADAGASASYEKDLGGIDFKKTTTTTDTDTTVHSVGSTIASGGNLNITSKKDITLQGASITSGGDTTLTGENVNVLAAQDTHTTSSKTTVEKVGLYLGTSNQADASAGTTAGAAATPGSATAAAGAEASADATSSNNIDFVRKSSTETTTTDVTNTGTSLAAGGNLKITSSKTLTVQGSDLSGDQGVDVTAKDMQFLAAQDTHDTTTTKSSSATGLYVDGKASADASTKAGASASLGVNAGASAEASAKADLSIGVQNRNSSSTTSEGTSTARVSTITSKSGSITRTAENSITDVGTAIDAAGDFSQSAQTITSKAAANTSYSSSSSSSDTTKVGVYAKAEAGVSAQAGAQAGAGADAGANAEATAKVGVGLRASHSSSEESSSSTSSEAVVSSIKAGGKLTSTSSGTTSLEGTQLSGGKGVELSASSLDYSAAKNTTTYSSSSGSVDASASAGISRGSGKGVEVDLSAATSNAKESGSTSTAVVGGISSGGDLVIKTTGDTRLEGTNLQATGDTSIATGGDLKFETARNTATSSSSSTEVSAGFSLDKKQSGGESQKGISASAQVGTSSSSASSSEAVAGSIGTGGKLTITSGKSASFEGTNIASGGDATISAKDSVTMSAAKSTSSSESTSVGVGLELGGSKSAKTGETSSTKSLGASVDVSTAKESSTVAVGGSVSSGGNLKITSGKDASFEGTDLSAAGKASIASTGGSVNFTTAESTHESSSVGVSVAGKAERTTTNRTLPAKAASTEEPAKKNPGTGGTQGSDGSKQSNEDLAKWQDKQGSVVQQLKDRAAGGGTSGSGGSGSSGGSGAAGGSGSGATGTGATGTGSSGTGGTGTGASGGTGSKTGTADGSKSLGAIAKSVAGGSSPTFSVLQDGLEAISASGAAADAGKGTGTGAGSGAGTGIGTSMIRDAATGAKGATGSTVGTALNKPVTPGVSTTKSSSSASVGFNVQNSKSTTQQAGSIKAGSGGIEISAGGGDVNLVGTAVSTSGDAAISASRDVNITAAKDTSSSLGVAGGLSAEQVSESTKRTGSVATNVKKTGSGGGQASSDVTENTMGVDGVAGGEWSRTSNPENGAGTSSGVPNVGSKESSKSKGAEIQTGGRTVITSGGKTTLVNTTITSEQGESINAGGGVERRTE